MSMHRIERQFTRIVARAKIHPPVVNRWTMVEGVSIDIGTDAKPKRVRPRTCASSRSQDDHLERMALGHDEYGKRIDGDATRRIHRLRKGIGLLGCGPDTVAPTA